MSHFNLVISTDNGTTVQTASNLAHAQIFIDQAISERDAGRVVIVLEEINK